LNLHKTLFREDYIMRQRNVR